MTHPSLNILADHHESDGGEGGGEGGGDDDRTMSPNMSVAVSQDLTM